MKTNKSTAIAAARETVGELSPIGDGYKFLTYDCGVNAWRESNAAPYHVARANRSQALIDGARQFLGLDQVRYDGGPWTDYIDNPD
jgi:hypothetical protein